jgi:hypothetical protein
VAFATAFSYALRDGFVVFAPHLTQNQVNT